MFYKCLVTPYYTLMPYCASELMTGKKGGSIIVSFFFRNGPKPKNQSARNEVFFYPPQCCSKMFQHALQLIGSFCLTRIIMQTILVAGYCLWTGAPHFPYFLLLLFFFSPHTGAVISFSTRCLRVGGGCLRFRRAWGKLPPRTEAPPCHPPACTHTSSCVGKLECYANQPEIFLSARGV